MKTISRRTLLKGIPAAIASATLAKPALAVEDTIKVGILHLLSGTMAISETTLKDTMLMLIEQRMPRAACWAGSWRRL